jgi:glutathione S-transferase
MRILYHWPLDPESRQARIALAEKKLKVKLEPINPWAPDDSFLAICAESLPPCLVDATDTGKVVITGARAICEYAHEGSARFPLLADTPSERAEARRLCNWFDVKFASEVNAYLMHERVEKGLTAGGAPHPPTLRTGREHLSFHLDYIEWLLESREWLAGTQFSLGDIAAGANISCLDFLSEIPWKTRPKIKVWYQKLKSRPSFRALLSDRVPGLLPPRHYADLDF